MALTVTVAGVPVPVLGETVSQVAEVDALQPSVAGVEFNVSDCGAAAGAPATAEKLRLVGAAVKVVLCAE